MKTTKKKMMLSRETVRHLNQKDLQGVAGGMINLSRLTQCDCETAIKCSNGCPTD